MSTDLIIEQLETSRGILRDSLEGVSHEDSLTAPAGGGNCINWIVGHIAFARNAMLGMLGGEPIVPPESLQRYGSSSEPIRDGAEAKPLDELVEIINRSHKPLLAAIRDMTDEVAATPVPNSPRGREDETVGTLLRLIPFHEAYHTGQVGLLRRTLGRERVLP